MRNTSRVKNNKNDSNRRVKSLSKDSIESLRYTLRNTLKYNNYLAPTRARGRGRGRARGRGGNRSQTVETNRSVSYDIIPLVTIECDEPPLLNSQISLDVDERQSNGLITTESIPSIPIPKLTPLPPQLVAESLESLEYEMDDSSELCAKYLDCVKHFSQKLTTKKFMKDINTLNTCLMYALIKSNLGDVNHCMTAIEKGITFESIKSLIILFKAQEGITSGCSYQMKNGFPVTPTSKEWPHKPYTPHSSYI